MSTLSLAALQFLMSKTGGATNDDKVLAITNPDFISNQAHKLVTHE